MFNSQTKGLNNLAKGSAILAALQGDMENLEAELAMIAGVQPWSGATTYSSGDMAYGNNRVYRSNYNGNLNHPLTNTYWWEDATVDSSTPLPWTGGVKDMPSGNWYGTSLTDAPPNIAGQSTKMFYRVNRSNIDDAIIEARDLNGISTWILSQNGGTWSSWFPVSNKQGFVSCKAASGTVIPNQTNTPVAFDTFFDNKAGCSFNNGSVLSPAWANFAKVRGCAGFSTAPASRGIIYVAINGAAVVRGSGDSSSMSAIQDTIQTRGLFPVVGGVDVVGINVWQSSGANNLTETNGMKTFLEIEFFG